MQAARCDAEAAYMRERDVSVDWECKVRTNTEARERTPMVLGARHGVIDLEVPAKIVPFAVRVGAVGPAAGRFTAAAGARGGGARVRACGQFHVFSFFETVPTVPALMLRGTTAFVSRIGLQAAQYGPIRPHNDARMRRAAGWVRG